MAAARTALQRLQSLLPEAAAWNEELEQAITSVQEIVRSLEGASDSWMQVLNGCSGWMSG